VYQVVLAAQTEAIAAIRPGASFREVHRIAGRALVRGLTEIGLLRGDAHELYERGAAALFFPHGIGHLLGLDVHDMEDLGDRAGYGPGRVRSNSGGERYLRLDRELEPGMCVTIEPGYYRIPFILDDPRQIGDLESALDRNVLARLADVRGVRIEDDVLVTESGAEILTATLPKAASDVEALVGS
jgi:Xaa-Pro aminopeptidase